MRSGRRPISGNGKGSIHASILGPNSAKQEERRTNLKYALFCLAVAVLLGVSRQLSKDASTTSSQLPSTLNVQFNLSIQRTSGEIVPEDHQSESDGQVVRFRLSNRGNHAVFYPVRPGTNVLEGHVVYRTATNSQWIALPWSPTSATPNVQELINQNVVWIEMPPGGWVDGHFRDPGWPGGDHAYVVDLKPEPNAKAISLLSPPYHFTAD